jgi:hypothetical protein
MKKATTQCREGKQMECREATSNEGKQQATKRRDGATFNNIQQQKEQNANTKKATRKATAQNMTTDRTQRTTIGTKEGTTNSKTKPSVICGCWRIHTQAM